MFPIQEILGFVLLFQKLGECTQWVPLIAPHLFQSYISPQLEIMQPPSLTPFWLNVPQSPYEVNFWKPKTQTFYKASLRPGQEPVYEFRYKVHDPKEENYQEKSETRVGDSVRGYYSVREPNGYIRLVKYVSDKDGFKTEVSHHHTEDNGGGYLFRMR